MSFELAKRYAKALFKFACDSNQVEGYLKSLEAMAPLFQRTSQFMHWIASPQIRPEQKKELLERQLGGICGRQLLDFFLLLVEKGRLQLLPQIVKKFEDFYAKKMGILHAKLITTLPIEASMIEKLGAKLTEKFGKKTFIHEEIDPSILAGFVLIIDSQMMDSSIKGKLQRLKKHLLREVP